MTPTVDGRTLHFEARGVYDGLSILWDRETGTLWHHLTGEGLHGTLEGQSLGPAANLLQTTVEAALAEDPNVEVAISDRPIHRRSAFSPLAERVPLLSRLFRRTIAREDTRLPTMDIGLGVWLGDGSARYYSMNTIMAAGGFVIDTLGGRQVTVFYGPKIRALRAAYTETESAQWLDEVLQLSNGESLRNGVLVDADGRGVPTETPLQVFTRWYGFALTFPETEIFR